MSDKNDMSARPTLRLRPAKGPKPQAGRKAGKKRHSHQGSSTGRPGSATRGKTQPHHRGAKGASVRKAAPIAADARRLCLQLLAQLFEENAHFDQAFARLPGLDRLDGRDRGFVRHLASMVLRHQGQLQTVIDEMVPKPPTGKARLVLMMGIAQLCILKTGGHAATNTSVELMRESGEEQLAGLTNAVLRRLIREELKPFHHTSPMQNLPDHLYESWIPAYGEEACLAIMRQVQQIPPLDISAKMPENWVDKLGGQLLNQTIRTSFDGDISQMAGYEDGAWWVQDIAAAQPALLVPSEAKTVIDLCAAPGGKTAQLAAAGYQVTAVERDKKRAVRLQENLHRLKLSADIQIQDGLDYNPAEPVDAVLLDAPCSATGTIRRRPDILLRADADGLEALHKLQLQLANQAANWLKPGGHLIYATCSLQPEEGEEIISDLLASRPDLSLSAISDEEAGLFAPALSKEGWLRLLPHHLAAKGGNDGFFIARLQRYTA